MGVKCVKLSKYSGDLNNGNILLSDENNPKNGHDTDYC